MENKEEQVIVKVDLYIDRQTGNALVVPEGQDVSTIKLSEEAKKILVENPIKEKNRNLKEHLISMEADLKLVNHEIKEKGYFINVIESNRGKKWLADHPEE